MHKKIIIFLLAALAGKRSYSQDSLNMPVMKLTLSEVMQLAGANNLTIKDYQLREQAALADLTVEKSWYLPTLYAGATAHYLNGAAMNTDGKIYRDITQHNFWGGLGVSGIWDPGEHVFKVKAARLDTTAARFQTQAIRNQTLLKVISAYFDLWATKLKEQSLQQLIRQSDTLVQQLRIQVQAGLRYQSELLLAETNYQHYQINDLKLKSQLLQTSALLAELLHAPQPVQILPGDTLIIPIRLLSTNMNTDAWRNDYLRRPEYRNMQAIYKSLQTQKKTVTTGTLIPGVYAGVNDGAFGPFITPLENTYGLNLGVMWQIPLNRFFGKGELKQYNAAQSLQQNKMAQFKDQVAQEIASTIAQLLSAQQSLTLAKEALQTSAEGLKQSIQRQQLRTAKPFEVFQAQQFYLQAQNDYADATATYNKAQYQLYVAEGNDL
ncbi:MAG: TolC family protein [Chitinophagaceae bacterium]|nr:MAG: TolC family protein [Chitinophagaceae bacterium]